MRTRTLLAVAMFSCTAACTCGPQPGPDGGTPEDSGVVVDAGTDAGSYDEFDAWRELQQTLRQSPDAVPARARALVAAHNAQGLFELVRDDVEMLPPSLVDSYGAGGVVRWGARATLRGQAGTPRERADLLAQLLTEAGYPADVVVGAPPTGVTLRPLLGRNAQRRVEWAADDAAYTRWNTALPRKPAPWGDGFALLDADGGVRARVLNAITPLLPASPTPAGFDLALAEVPLVRFTDDAGTRYANPNLDGVAFGESGTMGTPVDPPAPSGEHTLRVVISAARSDNPRAPFPLLEKTWNASDVAGRTVTASFVTPLTRAEARRTLVKDAPAFIPTLRVRGDGLDETQSEALSAIGTPMLRDGTRVFSADGGGLVIDGEVLPPSPTAAAALSSVASLAVEASAVAWPDVELKVSARTAADMKVPDLASDAFVVREGGERVVATLRRTRTSVPRVVLLFDRSSSIPPEFLTGAPTVGHDIAQAVFTQFPGAEVQVAAIDINRPNVAGPFVNDLASVDAQLATLSGTGSEVWTALDAFTDVGASCVVVITDADASDTLSEEMSRRLVRGPPAVVAAVGAVNTVVAQRIVALTRGQLMEGLTASSIATAVTGYLAAQQPWDYRIVYRAPATGPTTRQLSVSLRAPGTATVAASYDVPSVPVTPAALSALYLTVETNGRSVTRLLAGSAAATTTDVDAVEGALFGRFVLGVEAGAPSLSTMFDDILTERLENERAFEARRAGDAAALAIAREQSWWRVPLKLRYGSLPLPANASGDDVTFVDGLTVTLHATLPVLDTKVVRRFDLLPLSPRRTLVFSGSADPFALTLQRTAALAAWEATFAYNTLPALEGKTLALFDATSIETLGPQWLGAAYPTYADYHLLAPADGSVVAFWAVHRETGELIGVRPEGGVGSDESTEALVNRLQLILDAAGRAGEASGYNGIKVWADLESTKVELLGGVIMLFEGEGTTDDILGSLCEAAADAAGENVPGWEAAGMVPDDLESIYRTGEVLTGHDMPDVPGPSSVLCDALLGD